MSVFLFMLILEPNADYDSFNSFISTLMIIFRLGDYFFFFFIVLYNSSYIVSLFTEAPLMRKGDYTSRIYGNESIPIFNKIHMAVKEII